MTISSHLVMVSNVQEVGRVTKPWSLVKVPQVPPQVGIIDDPSYITLLDEIT